MRENRICGIDIIKALAAVFVISIHQIAQTHILALNVSGVRAFIILLFRYTVMSCVPLFLITTGYLQCKKTISKKFYKGIIPIIFTYLFISVFSLWYNIAAGGFSPTAPEAILTILNFTANNYAWYVEMFIGLFMLIPFLNLIYNNLDSKKKKLALIFMLIILTIAPNLCITLKIKNQVYDIIPDYWGSIYPLTYYFIGAYIREYSPKIKNTLNMAAMALSALLPTILIFIVARGGEFEKYSYIMNGYNSVSAMLIAVLIFLFLYDKDIKFKLGRYLVMDISLLSLNIYLFSNLIEKLVYPHMSQKFPCRLLIMIGIIFILSYIASKVQSLIFKLVKALINSSKPDKKIQRTLFH